MNKPISGLAKANQDAARKADGKFGTQERDESLLALSDAVEFAAVKRPTDLVVGDRLTEGGSIGPGEVITRIEHDRVRTKVWTDGSTAPNGDLHLLPSLSVHVQPSAPLDLSDPDIFEEEVERIVEAELFMHTPSYNLSIRPDESTVAERVEAARNRLERDVRSRLHRASQPSNISMADFNRSLDDPSRANGRAKTGDNVIFASPMHPDAAYEVVGKGRAKVIAGTDESGELTWEESGNVEYVLKDLATGRTTTSDLRQAGWRRIPAPGDEGPAARRIAR